MGPDEFHEHYPDSDEAGLHNNAYTNVMVAWIAAKAIEVLELLSTSRQTALRAALRVTNEELQRWSEMSRKMFVPFHDGVISQFEGYENLDEIDWKHYRAEYSNIQRMDRILRAEGHDPNRFKVSKQADAVMLFFLFDDNELRPIFERLRYEYDRDLVRRTVDYYDERSSHGSTLSFVAYAGVLAGFDPESSWERFKVALESDVSDLQGGTTKEGIHMGVMAGTLDLVQRYYVGARIYDGVLVFRPRLLPHLDGVSFSMRYRGTPLRVQISGETLTVCAEVEGFRVRYRSE